MTIGKSLPNVNSKASKPIEGAGPPDYLMTTMHCVKDKNIRGSSKEMSLIDVMSLKDILHSVLFHLSMRP